MPSDGTTAFISYSRQDSEFVLRMARDLKAAGANVWLDQLDIEPGQRWARALQEAITNAPRFLVILSPASVDSTNVEDEVAFALEEHKTIIPVLYCDCKVPFQLRPFQYADFRNDYDRGLKILLHTMGVDVPAGVVAAPAVEAVEEVRPKTSDATEQARAAEQARMEESRVLAAIQTRLEEQKQSAEQARVEEQKRQAAEQTRLERARKAQEREAEEQKRKEAVEQARLEEQARKAGAQAAWAKKQKQEQDRRDAEAKRAVEQARLEAVEQARREEEAKQARLEEKKQAAAEKKRKEAAEQARREKAAAKQALAERQVDEAYQAALQEDVSEQEAVQESEQKSGIRIGGLSLALAIGGGMFWLWTWMHNPAEPKRVANRPRQVELPPLVTTKEPPANTTNTAETQPETSPANLRLKSILKAPFTANRADTAEKTIISSDADKGALLGEHRLSLQWISWKQFGKAVVTDNDGLLTIKGEQRIGSEYVTIDGTISNVEPKAFFFHGTITTKATSVNNGQPCTRTGPMRFVITGNRPYWRLQKMENPCEAVTDYVDIYLR